MNEWLQRNIKPVAIALAWLITLAGTAIFVRRPQPTPIEIIPPPTATATAIPSATPTLAPLRVYVSGAVHKPDVYQLAPDAIVRDAVKAAGGFSEDADHETVNLAQPLYDGAQVHIARREETTHAPTAGVSGTPQITRAKPTAVAASRTTNPAANNTKINLNSATLAELDALPGIGPAIAQRIIDGRPYEKIEDLRRVKGIGDATFTKLQPFLIAP